MSSGFPYFLSPDAREVESLRGKSLWAIALGGVLIVLGMLALGYPHLFTAYAVRVCGLLLAVGGVLQAASAAWARGWGGFFLNVLVGLLYLFVGVTLLERPYLGAGVWTILLAVFFVATGLCRMVTALSLRFSGWGWSLVNGAVTLLLGLMIWRGWPGDANWVLGMLIGVEMIFSGWAWVMLGLAVRSVTNNAVSPR